MSIDIQNLTFGVPAAERDDDLIDCFVSSDTYQRLKSAKKTIILGNRGTGKSALFVKLASDERKSGNIVIQLSPEEYSYELLSQTMKAEAEGSWAKQGAYAAAWRYLLLVIIMRKICSEGKSFKKGPHATIYNFLRDNYSGIDSNPIGVMISYLKRLEGVKVGKYEAALRARELKKLYSLEELDPLLPAIEECCKDKKVVVMVDELDKGWDASEDAVSYVAGLFQSTISLNNKFENIRVMLSLRKELYDNIPALYEDAQKVRDIIENIDWDEERLFELICRRIGRKIPVLNNLTYDAIWKEIFTETLDYRQNKSFNYMIDRTLYRPREIIQFCNDVVENSKHGTKVDLPFNYRQIAEAEYAYSQDRLNDICSEYRFQYPGLKSIMETFRGHSYNYERNALEEHLTEILIGDLPIDSSAKNWCEAIDVEKLLEILWIIGFIRARAVGGLKARRRSGSSYLGSHQIQSLNLKGITSFHVHPMFRSYLGLKESKS